MSEDKELELYDRLGGIEASLKHLCNELLGGEKPGRIEKLENRCDHLESWRDRILGAFCLITVLATAWQLIK